MHADNSENLYEAIPESLKNMLLVMASAGVLQPESYLWTPTWRTIDVFLPNLKREIFPDPPPPAVPSPSSPITVAGAQSPCASPPLTVSPPPTSSPPQAVSPPLASSPVLTSSPVLVGSPILASSPPIPQVIPTMHPTILNLDQQALDSLPKPVPPSMTEENASSQIPPLKFVLPSEQQQIINNANEIPIHGLSSPVSIQPTAQYYNPVIVQEQPLANYRQYMQDKNSPVKHHFVNLSEGNEHRDMNMLRHPNIDLIKEMVINHPMATTTISCTIPSEVIVQNLTSNIIFP